MENESARLKVLLFDGNNALVRGIRAAMNNAVALSTREGIPTAPLLFFINTLSRHIRAERPDQVMVCWDGGHSTERLGISLAYKAHRPVGENLEIHFRLAGDFLSSAHIQQSRVNGWEGDDLLAAYCSTTLLDHTVVVSDDNDLLQLVSDRVTQVKVSPQGPADRFEVATVEAKFGCTPEQYSYLKALTGDPGDGVKGLDNVGPKRALKRLQAVDFRWPDLLATLSTEDRAIVEKAFRLVDLRHRSWAHLLGIVPMLNTFAPARLGDAGYPELAGFLDALEMESVLSRLDRGGLWE